MVYVFLAQGFEEIEATVPIDLLRRAGIEVVAVGVGAKTITAAHGLSFGCGIEQNELALGDSLEAVVLPGGMPGATNLQKSAAVGGALGYADQNGLLIAAICAAPTVLAAAGLLNGKRATVYPAAEYIAALGQSYAAEAVVYDAPILTARAAGSAFDFSLKIIEILRGAEAANKVAAAVYYTS